jgi:hypothetical protein
MVEYRRMNIVCGVEERQSPQQVEQLVSNQRRLEGEPPRKEKTLPMLVFLILK